MTTSHLFSDSSSQAWHSRLAAVECRDSTYKAKADPLVFARAEGSLVWGVDGKKYIDLCAGFGALPLGHNSLAFQEVAGSYLSERPPVEHAMGDVYPSVEKVLFLETLRGMLPAPFGKGAVALSGGQAVEIALKTAILATGKTGFVVFDGAYHGLDLGVLPLTAREDFRLPFKSWIAEDNVLRIPYGSGEKVLLKAIGFLEETCGFAAILVEPVQGRAGVITPQLGWLNLLSEVTHHHDGLLIFDEVFTGFGRLGCVTSAEYIDADILCFGKAIGGGFPISACFAKDEIMNAWPESTGESLHTGTFFGHPFCAAVGRKTMEQILAQGLTARALEIGRFALEVLSAQLASHPLVRGIRGQGLMLGVEFSVDGLGARLMDTLRKFGVIALPSGPRGETLSLTPALNIDAGLLESALLKIRPALESQ
ncbi:MAG: aspartate aminotransferase family protein [Proteobacteria bacterium]|nr:aspartate aminotransferase family protein [Pseudomonadota bacterium]